jgi:hypothetical protein
MNDNRLTFIFYRLLLLSVIVAFLTRLLIKPNLNPEGEWRVWLMVPDFFAGQFTWMLILIELEGWYHRRQEEKQKGTLRRVPFENQNV